MSIYVDLNRNANNRKSFIFNIYDLKFHIYNLKFHFRGFAFFEYGVDKLV